VKEFTALPLALGAFGWIVVVVLLLVLAVLWIYCLFALVVDGSISIAGKVVWALALIVLAPIAIPAFLFSRRRPSPA
jgi:hypothetical protein